MKKLFTFCASALLALTLSAQAEQPQGTFYLGAGDATELVNIFGNGAITIAPTLGYAVRDNIVVAAVMQNFATDADGNAVDASSLLTGQEGLNVWGLTVSKFLDSGFVVGLGCQDIMENLLEERRYYVSAGKMIMLGSISDHIYVLPNITIDADSNWESRISFGFRF